MILPIQKHLLTAVIAPHGITDIIHSAQHNTTSELIGLHGLSFASSWFLSHHNTMILDDVFIVSSIIHFRHDMPDFQEWYIPKYVWSVLLMMLSIHHDPNILFRYMVIMHVPNHYKMNWKFIEKNPRKNIGLVVVFSLLMISLGQSFPWMFESKLLFDISKGIVISHVLYNEKHIHHNPVF